MKTRPSAQGVTGEDRDYRGSTFREVSEAIFADPYYDVWTNNCPLPYYDVTTRSLLRGLISRQPWHFLRAAKRTIDSDADLRWGPDLRGQRRLLHPNGVCLTGLWEMDDEHERAYTGMVQAGGQSACCRSLFDGDASNAKTQAITLAGREALSHGRRRTR